MPLIYIENLLAINGILLFGILPIFNLIPVTQVSIVSLFLIIFAKKLMYKKIIFDRSLLIMFLLIFIITFIDNYISINFDKFKMFIGIIIYFMAYYWYLESRKNRLSSIIRIYVLLAFIVAIIGITQELGYILNIKYVYDSNSYGFHVSNITFSGEYLRIYSIMVEPSHMGAFLFPAVFLSLLRLLKYKVLCFYITRYEAFVIILALFLTFSLIAYIAFFTMLLFIYLNKNHSLIKKMVSLIMITVLGIGLMITIPAVNEKIQSIFSSVDSQKFLLSGNGFTVFALVSNAQVAFSSLEENPLFGSGLNSHKDNYKKYIGNYYREDFMELNSKDAGSLYIRILSEFGLFGLLLFLYFIFKYKINFDLTKSSSFLVVINKMAFICILLLIMRNGQYLNPLMIMMFSILMISYKKIRKNTYEKKYSYHNNMVSKQV